LKTLSLALLGAFAAAGNFTPAHAQDTDSAAGQKLFQQRCGACHQITSTRNGVGPHLQHVIGRAAGSIEGFRYSPALQQAGITWSVETLDAFLTNPGAMVRGTRMTQRFNNAADRKEIIEFLAIGDQ